MRLSRALPTPDALVDKWDDRARSAWSSLTASAEKMRRSAGRGAAFEESTARARSVLGAEKPEDHPLLAHPRVRRAVLSVWTDEAGIAESSLRTAVFDRVTSLDDGASSLLIRALAQLYYRRFDELDEYDDGLSNLVGRRLAAHVSRRRKAESGDVFGAVTDHHELVIGSRSPQRLAEHVHSSGDTLDAVMRRIGLEDYNSGRFATLARHHTYLTLIRNADPTQSHAFLDDLTDEALFKAPTEDRRMFGHVVIEAMTTSKIVDPHPDWRNTIIDIAGDPRARGTRRWNEWWGLIDERSRSRVIAWLATQDLHLFLDAVELYGARDGNRDLGRMFPDRKRFLLGLHDEGLIRETRLFAGGSARSSIRLQLGKDLRTDITPITGNGAPPLSAIYLDCGDFHVVEGSHNFKLWIYTGDRPRLISDWRVGSVSIESLRHIYLDESTPSTGIVHDRHKKWISDALVFLADNQSWIAPESVTTTEAYEHIKKTYVIPPKKTPRRRRA